mgnify:CR=1 FL=1
MRVAVLCVVLCILVLSGNAQKADLPHNAEADTPATIEDTTVLERPSERNPKRAALLSLAIPGLGQAYNKKYLKIPVVYAALGTAGYFFVSNRLEYAKLKAAYVQDSENTTGDFSEYHDLGYTLVDIQAAAEQYQTWSEYAGVAIFAVYALQVIDATVDAHLFYFDVDDDLSLNIQPKLQLNPTGGLSQGVALSLKF